MQDSNQQAINGRAIPASPTPKGALSSSSGSTLNNNSTFVEEQEGAANKEEEAPRASDCPQGHPQHLTPVGGRIGDFLQEWRKITSDKWIFNVIEYEMDFVLS